jgi:hypothetical protein
VFHLADHRRHAKAHQFILPARSAGTFLALQSTRSQFRAGISIIILKDNMTTNKEDCVHYFAGRFRSNSAWRTSQSIKFPDDTRNTQAAQRLLELESDIELSDALWNKVSPYYDESDSRWLAAVSEANRDVGFRKHPRDFAAWIENLLSNLTRN